VLRVRPIAMNGRRHPGGAVSDHVGSGSGSEVMQRIAAPMVGGMITAPLLSMFVIPAAYLLIRRPRDRKAPNSLDCEEPCGYGRRMRTIPQSEE